ncbi:hypothetical protein FD723_40375 (plasmid) [Nostoc sp. C052]|uniref:hypothetical protein n=1 Tax=Nostoc sp. C052 TaxID=2576902 RepID=UPI0015C34EBE|nr:hypothetical protein [Nostoc sp. C052]QLE46471.1 hypothetical protein FD723_40375 [Nostoc sp. C052]
MNSEYPEVSTPKQSIYDIDVDYATVNATFKAIAEFRTKFYRDPDLLIVGSVTYVSLCHYLMEKNMSQEALVNSFQGVPLILDPDPASPKDRVTAIFGLPKRVLSEQVTPDEVVLNSD